MKNVFLIMQYLQEGDDHLLGVYTNFVTAFTELKSAAKARLEHPSCKISDLYSCKTSDLYMQEVETNRLDDDTRAIQVGPIIEGDGLVLLKHRWKYQSSSATHWHFYCEFCRDVLAVKRMKPFPPHNPEHTEGCTGLPPRYREMLKEHETEARADYHIHKFAGQRAHDGNFHYVCIRCGKTITSDFPLDPKTLRAAERDPR